MDNKGSRKVLILYIYEILKRYSDANHKLSQSRIAGLVQKEYGMTCDRKTVGRNINALIDAGIDIETYDENNVGYYLREPLFTDSEIRMLIDSVLASRYICGSYARELVEKLLSLATVYLSLRIPHVLQADRWIHTDNPQVFLNIELLDEAIAAQRRVRFVYNCYGLDLKLHSRREHKYEVDPYQIACSNGRYYLIGNYDKHDRVTNFRIDLITDVEILDVKATPFKDLHHKKKSLNLAEYSKHAVNMYDGKKVSAIVRLKEERIGDIVDWFGKDITVLSREEDGHIKVRVTGSDKGIQVWAIQYGRLVEVLSPASLRQAIRQDVAAIANKYNRGVL